jgi:hypothetical protein
MNIGNIITKSVIIGNMVNWSHLKYNHWKTSLEYTLDKPWIRWLGLWTWSIGMNRSWGRVVDYGEENGNH